MNDKLQKQLFYIKYNNNIESKDINNFVNEIILIDI